MDANLKYDYTILIFVYNEYKNLEKMIPQIFNLKDIDFEKSSVLVVDDGSTDDVNNILEKYKNNYASFDFVSYRQNRGKSFAYQEAFAKINSKYVITLDGDGQDDLNQIKQIMDLLDKYDLVVTSRVVRMDKATLKKIFSSIANCLYKYIFNIDLNDFNCSLKGFRFISDFKKVYFDVGSHRFITYLLIKIFNYSYIEIDTIQKPREFGCSKYNLFFKRFFSFFFWVYAIKQRKYIFDRPIVNEFGLVRSILN